MRHLLLVSLSALPLFAQSNAVPGLDVQMYDFGDAHVYGRRGAAFPNGEAGINYGHAMCNGGSVLLPWTGGASGAVMLQTYPKIASLTVRESDGRMVQISGRSFMKHSRTAFNFTSGPCAPCQSGPINTWRLGCSDAYSSGFSSASTMGPTEEIDPWLGTWNPVGSYFDRGDPAVSGVAATDGIRSTITVSDQVMNRNIVRESELNTPGTFWGQVHLMVIGEPVANRGNNIACRQATFSWNGSSWTGAATGSAVLGPVLTRWTGATTATAGNGADDGRFMVGCKVTGPVGGFWHYELAVHNLDNASGGGALRVPLCPTARVRNVSFRDIDGNALNQWTTSQIPGELAWLATPDNAIEWNTLYNFWFDCDAAPVDGQVGIDRARLGTGQLTVHVGAQVPGALGHEHLGDGCGAPPPVLSANGLPTVPNPGYQLRVQGAAAATTVLVIGSGGSATSLGNGCLRFLDDNLVLGSLFAVADGTGLSGWNVPIPPGLPPFEVVVQAAQIVPSGAWLGAIDLTNAARVRIGGTGCP